jgi:hypothetical protein
VPDPTAAFAAAEGKLTRALSTVPDHARGHRLLGYVEILAKRAPQGIAECERALELDRNLASERCRALRLRDGGGFRAALCICELDRRGGWHQSSRQGVRILIEVGSCARLYRGPSPESLPIRRKKAGEGNDVMRTSALEARSQAQRA